MKTKTTIDQSPISWGWEKPINDTYYTLDLIDPRLTTFDADAPTRVWKANFRLADEMTKEVRYYDSLQSMFASWGGFFVALVSFFGLIFKCYNRARWRQYYSWDFDPEVEIEDHRVISTSFINVDEYGRPVASKQKSYKPPGWDDDEDD